MRDRKGKSARISEMIKKSIGIDISEQVSENELISENEKIEVKSKIEEKEDVLEKKPANILLII